MALPVVIFLLESFPGRAQQPTLNFLFALASFLRATDNWQKIASGFTAGGEATRTRDY